MSDYLRRLQAGEIAEIGDRGNPMGRIVPVGQRLSERIEVLRQSGLTQSNPIGSLQNWGGSRLHYVSTRLY